jgi:septum formation inhibitor-activating ATPase MinD
MVQVFKTNVNDRGHAEQLVSRIHQTFVNYRANFDCDDCDRILRVECVNELIESNSVIELLKDSGFHAEVLL